MHEPTDRVFGQLMAEALPDDRHFGHREHVELTWLALRRYGIVHTRRLIDDGIRRTSRYAGVPQKFNATVSRAWVEAVAYHLQYAPNTSFEDFIDANPALLDKRLLSHFYRSTTLASTAARTGWVPPDLAAFPWQQINPRS